MSDLHRVLDWAVPLALIAAGIIAGFLLERLALARLEEFFADQGWRVQTSLIAAIRRVIVLWCIVAGVYLAMLSIPAPANVVQAVNHVLFVLFVIGATLTTGRFAADLVDIHGHKFTKELGTTSGRRTMSLLATIAQLTIVLTGAIIVLDSLGIAISPLITALGVGGLAVALALQGVLSNIFSGLELIASHHVRPGDYIKLDIGGEGVVLDINWRNTTIRDATDTLVIIPNDKLASAVIWNYHLPDKDVFTMAVDVAVKRNADLGQVEKIAIDVANDVAREIGELASAPPPEVRFNTLTNDQVNVTTFLHSRAYMDGMRIRSEFIKRMHGKLNEFDQAG
jgi:small-conductance mechanosensitive channel